MSPEDTLQQAVASVEEIEDLHDIEQILGDLELVFEALRPEMQETASDLIGRLQDKRRDIQDEA